MKNNPLRQLISSRNAIILALFVFVSIHLIYGYWRKPGTIIKSDVLEYYAYLPAAFIHGDLTLKFKETDPEFFSDKIWGFKIDENYVIKVSMGMSIMYAPFFLLSHGIALLSPWEANGYTNPYAAGLTIASLFYFLWGLFLLRKILKTYYSEKATAITLLIIALGTNVIYYLTKEAALSHSFSFFLITSFVHLSQKWHKHPCYKTSLLLGLISGLIVLVRPTNGLIVLVFIFWNTKHISLPFIIKHYKQLISIIFFACIVWLPQLFYWKFVTGSYFYYSYGSERFYFLKPEIIEVLFGFRKGWLLYTPVMIFAIFGFYILFKKNKQLFLASFPFFLLNLYIISAWWCWWYGGSLGQRTFIDSYAIMALPLAAIIEHFIEKRKQRNIVLIVATICIIHNLFQFQKYTSNAIHWDSMSCKAYTETLFSMTPTSEFFEYLIPPDYENAVNGLNERSISMHEKRNIQNKNFELYVNPQHYIMCESPFLLPEDMPEKEKIHALIYKTSGNTFLHAGSFDKHTHFIHGTSLKTEELEKEGLDHIMIFHSIKLNTSLIEAGSFGLVFSITDTHSDSLIYYHYERWHTPITSHGQWLLFAYSIDIKPFIQPNYHMECYFWNIEGETQGIIDSFRVFAIKK